jgi:hypothetical protein
MGATMLAISSNHAPIRPSIGQSLPVLISWEVCPNSHGTDAPRRPVVSIGAHHTHRIWQEADVGATPSGCCKVAPLWPQAVHRAHCLSLSLEVSAPQRITGTAQASGA